MDKYLDTVTVKTGNFFFNTNLLSDMIFTKDDVSTSDDQVEKLTREFNIQYRACIESLIYLLSTRVELSFAVQKLANVSSNPGTMLRLSGQIKFTSTPKSYCLSFTSINVPILKSVL